MTRINSFIRTCRYQLIIGHQHQFSLFTTRWSQHTDWDFKSHNSPICSNATPVRICLVFEYSAVIGTSPCRRTLYYREFVFFVDYSSNPLQMIRCSLWAKHCNRLVPRSSYLKYSLMLMVPSQIIVGVLSKIWNLFSRCSSPVDINHQMCVDRWVVRRPALSPY